MASGEKEESADGIDLTGTGKPLKSTPYLTGTGKPLKSTPFQEIDKVR